LNSTTGKFGIWIALAVLSAAAHAQTYPVKPVRLIVAFPPGGTADLVARTLAQPLGAALGQNAIVDNRPGGGTVIATELVARAPADGYTLLLTGFSFTANSALRSNLPFDTQKDFAAVARIEGSPWMLAAHPSLPVKHVKELIALARSRPGLLTYASNPAGSGAHLIGAMLKLTTKINMVDVPYQGEVPAMIAVIGGHADMLIAYVPALITQLAAGKLRALGVTALQRRADAGRIRHARFRTGRQSGHHRACGDTKSSDRTLEHGNRARRRVTGDQGYAAAAGPHAGAAGERRLRRVAARRILKNAENVQGREHQD
jgi:tripartite-type tricarboxylate transporter receptor subunit TctC